MDLTDLPEEVSENIFALLPVHDILSCCLVNSRWREAVNKNLFWKRFCNPNIDLEKVECRVKPEFQPLVNESDLSSVCKYRLSYMREIHMRNNFRHNRFKEFKLTRIKNFQDKLDFLDNYLLLNDSYKNMFHVWDIENEPSLIQSVPYILETMCTETFQSLGDRFLIVQCNLLQVYEPVDGKFSLKICRVFDREEEFSKNIPSPDSITSWYSSNVGLYPCDFSSINETVGNYFFGVVESPQTSVTIMHIWDLESGKKLKEVPIPGTEDHIENICCGKSLDRLYIALYLQPPNCDFSLKFMRCKILSYCCKTMQYTQFYVETNHSLPFMMFEKSVVVLPCDQWEKSGCYSFLDATTGKTIVEKKFENPINPKALDVHESLLVFGSSNTVTIVDLNTHEVVTTFPVDFEVMEVYLLDHDILLVGGVDYHFVMQVWDIKKNVRLYTLDEKSILLCGRTMPRLCFQSMYNINVLHYW